MPKKNQDNEDTPAADTIQAHPTHSRSELMAMALGQVSQMTDDDLTKWLDDSIALSTSAKMAETIPDGAADANRASIEAKPSAAVGTVSSIVKEDLAQVIEGLELTPEVTDKFFVLFESAVSARVALETARIEDEYETKLAAESSQLADRVDSYLDEAAENFCETNELAVESTIRVDLYEEFIDGLKDLFEKHYIDLPADRIDVVEQLTNRVEKLENDLNETVKENLELRDVVLGERARDVFDQMTEGLTLNDKEKMKTLSESIDFEGDEDDLRSKLKIVREAHFPTNSKEKTKRLGEAMNEGEYVTVEVKATEGSGEVLEENVAPEMQRYVRAANRLIESKV